MKRKKGKEPESWSIDLESGFDEFAKKQLAEWDALAQKLEDDFNHAIPEWPEPWPTPSSDEVETLSKEKAKRGTPDEAGRKEGST